jgi:hypothetical protein
MAVVYGDVWYTLRSNFLLASDTEERGSIPRRFMTSAVALFFQNEFFPSARITDHRLRFSTDARGYERRWCLVHRNDRNVFYSYTEELGSTPHRCMS